MAAPILFDAPATTSVLPSCSLVILKAPICELCTIWYNSSARLFQEVSNFFSGQEPERFAMDRPREFDVKVFWQKGYEGTTIPVIDLIG
jgi:hypothetical protein